MGVVNTRMLGTTRIMLSAAACALGLPGFQFKASGFWVSGLGQGFGFRVWGPGLGGFSDAAMLAAMLAAFNGPSYEDFFSQIDAQSKAEGKRRRGYVEPRGQGGRFGN